MVIIIINFSEPLSSFFTLFWHSIVHLHFLFSRLFLASWLSTRVSLSVLPSLLLTCAALPSFTNSPRLLSSHPGCLRRTASKLHPDVKSLSGSSSLKTSVSVSQFGCSYCSTSTTSFVNTHSSKVVLIWKGSAVECWVYYIFIYLLVCATAFCHLTLWPLTFYLKEAHQFWNPKPIQTDSNVRR